MGGGTAECGFQDFEFLPLETPPEHQRDKEPAFEFF